MLFEPDQRFKAGGGVVPVSAPLPMGQNILSQAPEGGFHDCCYLMRDIRR
jgi:hypothetical protein